MKTKKLKGIEGLPLKYIAMLIVAAVILGAFISITLTLSNTTLAGVLQTNQTLNEILNKSVGNVVQQP